MRFLFTSANDGKQTAGLVSALTLISALGIMLVPPLAAQNQGEAPTAQADQSGKTSEAQDASPADAAQAEAQAEPSDTRSSKTYQQRNGTAAYGRTEEFEKKKTADGEVEIQRVRQPSYAGDKRVLFENETRTRELPDGTIERERILKNPDGSGRMVPIEIIREKVRTTDQGTVTEREVLKQDYSGHWRPLRNERVTETGEDEGRQRVKEVREKNSYGDWKVVDRTVTSEKSSEGETSTRSVRQTPDAHGQLADYEVREENITKDGDKETTEVLVRRRDTQDTEDPKFILVERTRTVENKSANGKVTSESVTESDLVSGGASRNVTPGASKVVEEKTEVVTTSADGSARRVTSAKERGAVNRELRSTGRIVQETDSNGNVRQILLPSK